jgi:hypothetical protein
MPALVAIHREPFVRRFYQRLLRRGKAPLQAVVAVMRKLLHALFAMFRLDQPLRRIQGMPSRVRRRHSRCLCLIESKKRREGSPHLSQREKLDYKRERIYSYTQISQYLSCPRRYKHRYLDGWKEKDTRAAMLFGRAFEQAVGVYFQRQDASYHLAFPGCGDLHIADPSQADRTFSVWLGPFSSQYPIYALMKPIGQQNQHL